jgi:type II pantothenate kinase
VDIVLGILPFVRALLFRGTSVILCANEWPALNDVTNVELDEILQRASVFCPVLSAALATGDLVVRSSGQRGPCLDLRTISVGECFNPLTAAPSLGVKCFRVLNTTININEIL